MMKICSVLNLCLVATLLCAFGICPSVDRLAAQEPSVPEPGPEHKILAKDVGKWEATVEMMVPGQPEPLKSKGTEEVEVICEGMFVRSKFVGDVVGMPFEGQSIMGYDMLKKKYTGVWVDNFGSSLYQMEGTYDDDSNTMAVIMTGPDPTTGDEMTQKHITTHIDENTKRFDIFMADPSGQSDEMVKIMTMTSVRKE